MVTGMLITGASGLLGSALTQACSDDPSIQVVVACDIREPTQALREASTGAIWEIGDVSDAEFVDVCFEQLKICDQIFVYHFAAYYDFDLQWSDVYEKNNIIAVHVICRACIKHHVKRLIFTSSISVYDSRDLDQVIDEQSQGTSTLPYGLSKLRGEDIIAEYADLPHCILRVGGVFTEQCDLPPLYSLLRLWLSNWPLNRMLIGKGLTGIPYIHRLDFTTLAMACLKKHQLINKQELFLACGHRSITHAEILKAIKDVTPLLLPVAIARVGLSLQLLIGRVTKKLPFERPWMLGYVDKSLNINNNYTCSQLNWSCTERQDVLKVAPLMYRKAMENKPDWVRHNNLRSNRSYEYRAD